MTKRLVFIDMGPLSLKDQKRFLDFFESAGDASPQDKVKVWNKHAKNVSQHVFVKIREVHHS